MAAGAAQAIRAAASWSRSSGPTAIIFRRGATACSCAGSFACTRSRAGCSSAICSTTRSSSAFSSWTGCACARGSHSVLRILYVALTENEQVRGVERYALELVRELATRHRDAVHITLLCGEWQRYFWELEPLGVAIDVAECRNTRASRHWYLWTRLRARSAAFDLIHYGNLLPILVPNRVPSTMTIHDVAEYAIARKYSLAKRGY